jgi:predicted nucleotidyltransferase
VNAVGVITEFNPFHDGHSVHLRESREFSGRKKVIAVSSGNFVQRGEPAIFDKWRRAKIALEMGVDIRLELPVPYVIGGADYFARGSVGILAATGVVDALSFGSEAGDVQAIKTAGEILANEPPIYKETLRSGLDKGLSFAAARGAALEACFTGEGRSFPDGLFTKPNNCLAIEYCKALKLLGDPMEIFTTHRKSGGPSATKIRQALMILTKADQPSDIAKLDDFSEVFRYLLITQDFKLGEGLENRFRRFCADFSTISDFLTKVKTKRYTFTRLQRAVLGILLGINNLDYFENHGGVQYIRVLGFRKESADLLGEMVRRATLPVITHGEKTDEILAGAYGEAAAKMLAKELEVGDIYNCATGKSGCFRAERGAQIVVV